MSATKMSKIEWNKAVDKWLEGQAGESEGEGRAVEWPPEISALRGGIENKIATPDLMTGYAAGIGSTNPLYTDPDYARKTKWGSIIAPPTFEDCIGVPYDFGEIYKLPGSLTIMNSGTIREYFTEIRPLDEFTAIDYYLGAKEIPEVDKPYRRFLQQIQRTYFNQRFEKVAVVVRDTTIVTDAPGAKYTYNNERFRGVKKPHYNQEQLDEIYQAFDDELENKWVRGGEIRYWEDVNEGEEIHPIYNGPLDDNGGRFVAKFGFARAFALKWAAIKQDLTRAIVDSETGEYVYINEIYMSDHLARAVGLPYAAGFPLMNEAIVATAVTNWMGDDGFIIKLNMQHESMNFYGDIIYITGKVSKKYTDKRERLVDLDVRAECPDSRTLIKGVATVRLLSRGG